MKSFEKSLVSGHFAWSFLHFLVINLNAPFSRNFLLKLINLIDTKMHLVSTNLVLCAKMNK